MQSWHWPDQTCKKTEQECIFSNTHYRPIGQHHIASLQREFISVIILFFALCIPGQLVQAEEAKSDCDIFADWAQTLYEGRWQNLLEIEQVLSIVEIGVERGSRLDILQREIVADAYEQPVSDNPLTFANFAQRYRNVVWLRCDSDVWRINP